MFEKEEEIKTIDNKWIKYQIIFLKKVWEYCRKPLIIPCLEIWPFRKCNLRCQHCVRLMPYVKEEEIDIQNTINDLKQLLALTNIQQLIIAGGNPFMCNGLYQLITFAAAKENVSQILIKVNGTTLPDLNTLKALKGIKKQFHISIQEYPVTKEQTEKLCLYLQKEKIPYKIKKLLGPGNEEWKMTGGPFQKKLHFETTNFIYADCIMKRHLTLYNGILTSCPRGINAGAVFNISQNPYEFVVVKELKKTLFSKVKLAMLLEPQFYQDYCQYCLGLSKENPYWVVPGEQYLDDFVRRG